MKKAQILHNPTSGDAEHEKDEIRKIVEKSAEVTAYLSTDRPFWERFVSKDAEIIFVAGGDGTVHKVAKFLLFKDRLPALTPIFLMPYGTANNIAHTLHIPEKIKDPRLVSDAELLPFDVGRVKGAQGMDLFLEGMGFGIFPKLIKEMRGREKEDGTPSEELQHTLKHLVKLVEHYVPGKAEFQFDNNEVEGHFLLAECLNINFIGPNIKLAPHADPGDGQLDLVLIREDKREELISYLKSLIAGTEKPEILKEFTETHRVRKLKMKWSGSDVHVDDDLVEDYKNTFLEVEVDPAQLRFVPGNKEE
ncbi:diacylglycerol/lipid kinase family protein [Salinimicrobium soli]|uniref:diacylglycerol/lipid kinase family protein n=1 Tax=Salinimicrobium soli TaxID=1254399 RepID=UPI003AAACE5D